MLFACLNVLCIVADCLLVCLCSAPSLLSSALIDTPMSARSDEQQQQTQTQQTQAFPTSPALSVFSSPSSVLMTTSMQSESSQSQSMERTPNSSPSVSLVHDSPSVTQIQVPVSIQTQTQTQSSTMSNPNLQPAKLSLQRPPSVPSLPLHAVGLISGLSPSPRVSSVSSVVTSPRLEKMASASELVARALSPRGAQTQVQLQTQDTIAQAMQNPVSVDANLTPKAQHMHVPQAQAQQQLQPQTQAQTAVHSPPRDAHQYNNNRQQ